MGNETVGALVPDVGALDDPALGLHDEAAGHGLGPQSLLGVAPGAGAAIAGVLVLLRKRGYLPRRQVGREECCICNRPARSEGVVAGERLLPRIVG